MQARLWHESGSVRVETLSRLSFSAKTTSQRFSLFLMGEQPSNMIRRPLERRSRAFAPRWAFQPLSRFSLPKEGLSNSSKVGDKLATPDFIYFENSESARQPYWFLEAFTLLENRPEISAIRLAETPARYGLWQLTHSAGAPSMLELNVPEYVKSKAVSAEGCMVRVSALKDASLVLERDEDGHQLLKCVTDTQYMLCLPFGSFGGIASVPSGTL